MTFDNVIVRFSAIILGWRFMTNTLIPKIKDKLTHEVHTLRTQTEKEGITMKLHGKSSNMEFLMSSKQPLMKCMH